MKMTGKLKSLAGRYVPDRVAATLRIMKHYGNRFTCPCCQGTFRKLLTYGANARPNAKCPKCGLLERHRLIWLFLKNETGLFVDETSLLHFAPEEFFQKEFLSLTNLSYVSADLDSPNAMLKMDITDISFRDNVFDMILCSHVLEHVQDDRKAMSEMFRVLKPGGLLIAVVPIKREQTLEDPSVTSPGERKRLFGQADHVRQYGRDFAERLQQAGFSVKVIDYAAELGPELKDKYALVNMSIHCCTKLKSDCGLHAVERNQRHKEANRTSDL